MSGDTFVAIVAVSLTAIFISVFAIECDRVWQRYRASRRREMEERVWFSRRQKRSDDALGARGPLGGD